MNPDPKPAIGIGAVAVREGAILLIRRATPPFEGHWSLPGGKLESFETIAQCLVREILEETGLEIQVGQFAGLRESIHPELGFHFVILDYHVTVTGGQLVPGDDVDAARWVQLDEVKDLSTTPNLCEALKEFGIL